MLTSLLSAALSNLIKDRTSSAVNIVVITCFITFALIMMLNIMYESSYDKYHQKAENIYRIVSNVNDRGHQYLWNVSQASLGPELLRRYPEVRNAVRFFPVGQTSFSAGGKDFAEDGFYRTDPAVFTVFTFEMLAGHCTRALTKPNSIVLTEELAKKYFGGVAKAMHQTVISNKGESLQVTGVMKNVPPNSHLRFDGLISVAGTDELDGGWANFSAYTYIELPNNYNARRMYGHLKNLADEKLDDIVSELDVKISYQLQNLTSIHKTCEITDAHGYLGWPGTFLLVSGGIIFISGFVLMLRHGREKVTALSQGEDLVKAMGIRRTTLIVHLIAESVCLTIIAFFLGVGLVYTILPVFNELMNKEIPFSMLWDSSVALMMVAVFVFSGFIGAIYPSFYLPRYHKEMKLSRAALKKEEIFLA
jgi:putative ABC transport system permease protein